MPAKLGLLLALAALGAPGAVVANAGAAGRENDNDQQPASSDDRVIAIDVLLLPDATMAAKAQAVNAQLRADYPAGYTLGKEQVAHCSLVHRYVRQRDLPAIEAAIAKAAAAAQPLAWQLTAKGIENGVWSGVAITTIAIERTPELDRFQEVIVKAVEPFAVRGGTAAAFCTSRELPKIQDDIVKYVADVRHTHQAVALIMSKASWNKLDAAGKKAVEDAWVHARAFNRKFINDEDKSLQDLVRAKGVTITKPNAAPFLAATKGVYDEFYATAAGKNAKPMVDYIMSVK